MGPWLRSILQSLCIILLIVITVEPLVCYVLSKVLNARSQPSAVHQMVSLHLEKQKQDEKRDEQQKQFFHGSDIKTYVSFTMRQEQFNSVGDREWR